MKIALCLSGQMRTYKMCYNNLKKHILEPFNPDVFIHTWSKTGIVTKVKLLSIFQGNQQVTEKELQKMYSPKNMVIEDFHNSYLEEIEGVRYPEILTKYVPPPGRASLPMYYKIKKCNDLKCEEENKNNFKYDLVIRLRPDLNILEPLPGEVLDNSHILWHSGKYIDTGFMLSDRFAVSNSQNMDYYSSVFDKLNEYWQDPLGNDGWKTYRIAERLIKQHMDFSDIEVKPFYSNCIIQRTKLERITMNLNKIFK